MEQTKNLVETITKGIQEKIMKTGIKYIYNNNLR